MLKDDGVTKRFIPGCCSRSLSRSGNPESKSFWLQGIAQTGQQGHFSQRDQEARFGHGKGALKMIRRLDEASPPKYASVALSTLAGHGPLGPASTAVTAHSTGSACQLRNKVALASKQDASALSRSMVVIYSLDLSLGAHLLAHMSASCHWLMSHREIGQDRPRQP